MCCVVTAVAFDLYHGCSKTCIHVLRFTVGKSFACIHVNRREVVMQESQIHYHTHCVHAFGVQGCALVYSRLAHFVEADF